MIFGPQNNDGTGEMKHGSIVVGLFFPFEEAAVDSIQPRKALLRHATACGGAGDSRAMDSPRRCVNGRAARRPTAEPNSLGAAFHRRDPISRGSREALFESLLRERRPSQALGWFLLPPVDACRGFP